MNGADALDPRLNAFRDDLADETLRGRVEAAAYSAGARYRIGDAVVPLHRAPGHATPIDTEILFGETVRVFDRANGWAWCQAETDAYTGYVPVDVLREPGLPATHRVAVLATPLYPEAELRRPAVTLLSLGSAVRIDGHQTVRDLDYALLEDGTAIVASHLVPIDQALDSDFVGIAERFLGLPYLWAGRSGRGVDCSGLLQLALHMTGVAALRDTDMQERSLGFAIERPDSLASLRRGDLIFWNGHVGIISGANEILHASGYHMLVAKDPLDTVVDRLESKGLPITSIRRISD
ncbi:MAG: NlpC/P60 family protein [Pseudomonadota bacterium]